nr:F-box domain containing protein [Pandoravirus aubagnensis]
MKSHNGDDPTQQASWSSLPDEIGLEMMRWCSARDLGNMSLVDHRCRRVALDESLWEALYTRAFPPCPIVCGGTSCISGNGDDGDNHDNKGADDWDWQASSPLCMMRLGEALTQYDIAAVVARELDRLADPTSVVDGIMPRLPAALCAAANMGHRIDACPHHWPSIIAARGYRWALAVACVDQPRLFGPHLDGSPTQLIGCMTLETMMGKERYRGDLMQRGTVDGRAVDSDDKAYHGHNATDYRGRNKATQSTLVRHGYGHVRYRWAQHPGVMHWIAGRWVDGDRSGIGFGYGHKGFCQYSGVGTWAANAAVSIRYGPDSVECGHHSLCSISVRSPRVRSWRVLQGQYGLTQAAVGNRAGGDGDGDGDGADFGSKANGIVRGVDGTVLFQGRVGVTPEDGRLFSRSGTLLYKGALTTARTDTSGIVYVGDGRTMKINLRRGALTVHYTNGDCATWDRATMRLVSFEWADGSTVQAPHGWDIVFGPVHALIAPAAIQDTVLRFTSWPDIQSNCNAIASARFWPRAGPSTAPTVGMGFLDSMARRHGPVWAQCRDAVSILYASID